MTDDKLSLDIKNVGRFGKEFTVSRGGRGQALAVATASIALLGIVLADEGLGPIVRGTIATLLALCVYTSVTYVVAESLLYVENLGVQTSTSYAFWPGRVKFLDRSRAIEVVINEGITCFTVQYYMAVLVRDRMKMELVFPNLMPPLPILTEVYRNIQTLTGRGTD
ncbi:hypothetical protein DFJ74DRAFT_330303 [Hyaloraphidium curvatum]|nr:hypothetical protein DFJ74DRAFT_330303 [Hyaloraphidium curvatum]